MAPSGEGADVATWADFWQRVRGVPDAISDFASPSIERGFMPFRSQVGPFTRTQWVEGGLGSQQNTLPLSFQSPEEAFLATPEALAASVATPPFVPVTRTAGPAPMQQPGLGPQQAWHPPMDAGPDVGPYDMAAARVQAAREALARATGLMDLPDRPTYQGLPQRPQFGKGMTLARNIVEAGWRGAAAVNPNSPLGRGYAMYQGDQERQDQAYRQDLQLRQHEMENQRQFWLDEVRTLMDEYRLKQDAAKAELTAAEHAPGPDGLTYAQSLAIKADIAEKQAELKWNLERERTPEEKARAASYEKRNALIDEQIATNKAMRGAGGLKIPDNNTLLRATQERAKVKVQQRLQAEIDEIDSHLAYKPERARAKALKARREQLEKEKLHPVPTDVDIAEAEAWVAGKFGRPSQGGMADFGSMIDAADGDE